MLQQQSRISTAMAALHCPAEQVFGEGLSTVLADARAVLSEASLATTDFADTAFAEFAGGSVQRITAKTSAGLAESPRTQERLSNSKRCERMIRHAITLALCLT